MRLTKYFQLQSSNAIMNTLNFTARFLQSDWSVGGT